MTWRGRPRWWLLGLVGVFAAALTVRIASVTAWYPTCDVDIIASVEPANYPECPPGEFRIWGDTAYSYLQGYLLAEGHGFVDSATWVGSRGTSYVPSAGDPPLYAVYVAGMFKAGLRSGASQRIANGVVGSIGVVLLSLVTARLAGRRAGLLAGGIGALYPMLWINDGMMLSESTYVAVIALVLLAAYRFTDRPSHAAGAWLGAAIAMAALTRGEAILLFGVLVIPLLLRLRGWSWRRRLAVAAVCWTVGGVLIAPWVVYNLGRFRQPVFLTSQTGAVLSAGSCDVAFYGESLGYYGADCYSDYIRKGYPVGDPRLPGCDAAAAATVDLPWFEAGPKPSDACWPDPKRYDESERDKVTSDLAIRYIKDHKRRLPLVMVARVARMFDLYNPELGSAEEPFGQNTRFNWQVEGRGKWQSRAGFLMYVALLIPAVAGVVVLKRRRLPLAPLLALPAVITVTAALAFGVTRYRVPVDVMLVVLAGVAGDQWLRRRWPVATPDEGSVHPVGESVATTLPSAPQPPIDGAGRHDAHP